LVPIKPLTIWMGLLPFPRMSRFFIKCCSSSISFSNKDFPLVTLGNLGKVSLVQLLFLGTATLVGGIVFRKLDGFHGCCSDFVSLPCLVGNPVCLSQYQAGWKRSKRTKRAKGVNGLSPLSPVNQSIKQASELVASTQESRCSPAFCLPSLSLLPANPLVWLISQRLSFFLFLLWKRELATLLARAARTVSNAYLFPSGSQTIR